MMRFESPWALLLLLALPAVFWLSRRRGGRAALRFSSIAAARQAGASWRQRLSGGPDLLRWLAMALLVLALARPQRGREQVRDVSRGVAIMMVVDRSSSMAQELSFRGLMQNRLEVVKQVFAEFVKGNGRGLRGRPHDLVGMVAFARYADTVCPLTLGHGALDHFLGAVRLVNQRSEDGTAIGDAVALAAARLKTAEETLARQTGEAADAYRISSKVIVLLTDGENNCGDRSPEEAAALAAEWGIRIYAIGVAGGEAFTVVNRLLGAVKLPGVGPQIDTSTLERLASRTGGRFFRADDARGLEAVYEEIDRLERSDLESLRYVDYRESYAGFVALGLALLVLEVALRCTAFRRLP
ncbi:MAG: VWA domain-containing protein [Lentisphaerae bacterium]|nr:VWA domain-containing protein [Lentisphaerota bacterium]